jgi:hypothetical protein
MSYLARLRELETEKGAGPEPAKGSKGAFAGFAGDPSPRNSENNSVACPPEWSLGFAELERRPIPPGTDGARWIAMMAGAKRFLADWAGTANALGWSAGELFGLDPFRPLDRLDRRGAAFFLGDAEVVAVSRELIKLRVRGNTQSLRRREGFTAPAWALADE